jgi:hypothetical protein
MTWEYLLGCWFPSIAHLMHVRFGLILWALLVVEFVLVLSGAALRYPGNDLQRQDDTTPARRQQGTLLLTPYFWP